MNIALFVGLMFAFQILYWWIAKKSSKQLHGQEDYFLAGKNVKLFPLIMTFLGAQVGGGLVLGAAEEAYRFGWPVLLYPLGAVLGLICLGCGVGKRLAAFKVSTVAQIFEVSYGSILLKKIASLLSIISLFMILIAQIIASSKFLIGLGLDNTLLFVIFWGIVIAYTVQGGFRAVISTDIIQVLLFSVVFLVCFAFIATSGALTVLPKIASIPLISSKLSSWLFMPLLFMLIEQDMGQRCFAGVSGKVVSKASWISGVLTMTICLIPVILGVLARSIELEIPQGGSVMMVAVAKLTNPYMTAFVGCAVLAAIISTATSLINAISSNISNDFKLPSFKKISPVKVIQLITIGVSLSALIFAFYFNNIVDLLIQSYELSVSCLFVPIFMALFQQRKSSLAAWFSLILGAIGFTLFRICPLSFPKEIITVGISFSGYYLGVLLSAYQERKV